jgi:hypothetical protein
MDWLKLLSAWGVTVINTSSINPSARGMAECEVNLVKLMMKKYLSTATHETYNWDMLTYICTKVINYSINPISGIMPAQMIYGKDDNGPSFLQTDEMAPPHYSIKSDKLTIEKITQEIKEMTEYARDKITQARIVAHERVNKNRITKNWAPGDIVFVLDRAQIPGNTRPLKTKFSNSPCVIVRCLFNTSLIRRLSDNFVSLYANDALKKYDGADPIFSTLPKEISKVLLHKFQDFLSFDFTEIAKFDTFDIPNGIQLFDPVEEEIDKNSQIIDTDIEDKEKSDKSSENQEGASASTVPQLKDEFYDDLNDIAQIPHLDDQRRDIADDLAQLYADDPAQAPVMEETPTLDADSSPTPKPTVTSDSESDEDLGPRRLRGAKAKKTVRFPDMSAYFTAW